MSGWVAYMEINKRNKYLIPNPSGLSKIIGSLRPLLWMNSYVKSNRKTGKPFFFSPPSFEPCHRRLNSLIPADTVPVYTHQLLWLAHECASTKYPQFEFTFSLHVIDQIGTEPLTADFLLQVKRPPAINLFIRDAIIVVMSPGPSPLWNENEVTM